MRSVLLPFGLALVLLTAGCGGPAATDGDLDPAGDNDPETAVDGDSADGDTFDVDGDRTGGDGDAEAPDGDTFDAPEGETAPDGDQPPPDGDEGEEDGDGDGESEQEIGTDPHPPGGRLVLASLPYTPQGGASDRLVGLLLGEDGTLSPTGQELAGVAPTQALAFSSDGRAAVAASGESGEIAIFSARLGWLDEVVRIAPREGLYPSQVVADPLDPDRFYLVCFNGIMHGGGIYLLERLKAGWAVQDEFLPAHVPQALVVSDDGLAGAAVASPALDAPEESLLIDLSSAVPRAAAWLDLWGDWVEAYGSGLSSDGLWLVPNSSPFSTESGRLTAVTLDLAGWTASQPSVVEAASEPRAVVFSSDGRTGLVSNLSANSLTVLAILGDRVTVAGTVNGFPLAETLLPVRTPGLPDHLLAGTLDAITLLAFTGPGSVEEVGGHSFGSGYDGILGTLALQP